MHFRCSDIDLFYVEMGCGPAVVLLHAFPSCHELWLPVAERLAPRYRTILLDLRGHGASGLGEGIPTMQKHAGDLDRLCRHLDIGKAVFAGVSIGGYVLFEFWRRHRDRVRALALCDTRASADTDEGRRARLRSAEEVLATGPGLFLDGMIEKLVGETTRRNRPDIATAARATMRSMTAERIAAVQQGMAARPDSIPTLKTICVPVQIIAGEQDGLTPVADAQKMHAEITGSGLNIIPAAGHLAIFEQPDQATRILRAFLDSLPAQD